MIKPIIIMGTSAISCPSGTASTFNVYWGCNLWGGGGGSKTFLGVLNLPLDVFEKDFFNIIICRNGG